MTASCHRWQFSHRISCGLPFQNPFGCHQKFGTGIQMKKFICPLQGQMVGNNKQCLLAQSQAFTFHSVKPPFQMFVRTNLMCQQGIPTIQHMGNGISLVPVAGYRDPCHQLGYGRPFTRSGELNSSLYLVTSASRRCESFQIQSRNASLIACCFCCARVVSLFSTRFCLPSASSMVS